MSAAVCRGQCVGDGRLASGAAAAERACPSSGRAVAWEGGSTSPRRTHCGRRPLEIRNKSKGVKEWEARRAPHSASSHDSSPRHPRRRWWAIRRTTLLLANSPEECLHAPIYQPVPSTPSESVPEHRTGPPLCPAPDTELRARLSPPDRLRCEPARVGARLWFATLPLSGCVSVLCARACVRACVSACVHWLRAKRLRARLSPPSHGEKTYAGLCHGADETSRLAHMCRWINSTDTRVKF